MHKIPADHTSGDASVEAECKSTAMKTRLYRRAETTVSPVFHPVVQVQSNAEKCGSSPAVVCDVKPCASPQPILPVPRPPAMFFAAACAATPWRTKAREEEGGDVHPASVLLALAYPLSCLLSVFVY